jgi:nickel/cobalt transporter (NicO) family protein
MRRTRRLRRALLLAALAVLSVLVLPALALAHPLGNFTINHYAGLRIEPDRVLLDVVIDQAEIPAFQARQALDSNDDGEVSERELEAGREPSCAALADELRLVIAGSRLEPDLTVAGIALRPGVGGLSTLRLVCGFEAPLSAPLETGAQVEFADESNAGRLGWREIVVEGSGVAVTAIDGELRAESVSDRLLAYPPGQLESALADERIVLAVSPGGAELPPLTIPDAEPIDAAGDPPPADGGPVLAAAVPGGVAGEIPALFQATDLTPVVLLVSLSTAAVLGAGHALTPGHGKTLMAAYLVGTRGTPVHAVGLGLSVSASHTLGILVLAFVVIGAQGVLNPDLVVRLAPLVAAVTIVAIGGWMLAGELRHRSAGRRATRAPDAAHGRDHPDDDHEHDHEHSHGGIRHSHVPADGARITWRSLFVLGLAGGIIPSTSALLILLGAVAAGRPVFGIVLVVAFGLGMAAVMAGVGLLIIGARGRLDAVGADSFLGRARAWVPLAAACLVLTIGAYLTVQAVAAPPAL